MVGHKKIRKMVEAGSLIRDEDDPGEVYLSKSQDQFKRAIADRFGLARDLDSCSKDAVGLTPLHYAARLLVDSGGLLKDIRSTRWTWDSLLNGLETHEMEVQDEDGRTALSHAAEVGNLHAVRKLLKAGIQPGKCDNNGRSPLSWAAQFGQYEVIRQLRNHQCFHDDKDNQGWTPLHYLLQSASSNYPPMNPTNSMFALIWKPGNALWNGSSPPSPLRLHAVERIQVPPDHMSASSLRERDSSGFTLLSRAVQLNNLHFARTLLAIKGIDVNRTDNDGKTPLWRAIEADNKGTAALLWDEDQVTFRLLAKNAHTAFTQLQWLIASGYPIDKEHHGDRQLVTHILLDIPDMKVAGYLMERVLFIERSKIVRASPPLDTTESSPNRALPCLVRADAHGLTPLVLAKERRVLPMVKLLLRHRAEVDPFEHKSDWFSLLCDNTDWEGQHEPDQIYPHMSVELILKRNNTHILEFHPEQDITPQGCLVKRRDVVQHMWLHNSNQNWIATLKPGLYYKTESYAYGHVHPDTVLSELTCLLSAVFPDPHEGFFKRHTPFHVDDITSHNCWCVSWTWPRFGEASGNERPVFYSSTLSLGQIPESDDRFLQQFISEISQEWSRICDGIETHMIDHCKGDEANASVVIDDLADDSRFLATIQKALQDQTKAIQKVIETYRRLDAATYSGVCLRDSEHDLRQFKASINERLDKQNELVRDLRQMEFARISVEEAVFMRRISLITSLFRMNVNVLQNNPYWRWYIVFGVASLLLTYVLWKISDRKITQEE
ncbi:ankyrin [Aspergillus sclerotiicarbonarius CBS 121057]|uniref:Ankyrin n=1 Tax=Aspergillus sclerotiicarbonarius (strain CBS 121057 / IBT 28362) TaxID=1448318 RepID=A0A319EB26_ASPSB|nr:ankyrin [Aspergillus sclerotiicarbonarius CBS 121057]